MIPALQLDEVDPLTGTPRPWTFKGWAPFVEWCRQQRDQAPWALDNAIAWRAEKAQAGPWPADLADRDIATAQVLVGLALAELVRREVL